MTSLFPQQNRKKTWFSNSVKYILTTEIIQSIDFALNVLLPAQTQEIWLQNWLNTMVFRKLHGNPMYEWCWYPREDVALIGWPALTITCITTDLYCELWVPRFHKSCNHIIIKRSRNIFSFFLPRKLQTTNFYALESECQTMHHHAWFENGETSGRFH